jgi:hypothetical protein
MALDLLMKGRIPAALSNGREAALGSKGVLVVGMGGYLAAIEVMHP